ncbi:MAG TPA: cyclic nucleotide-binding domain-containing protein [Candidatus Hydrogenedentes bacterium]|nr:cyclic nucleotide-binding domain-containing protein [Candidatus Hydrogenedentota bacterium]HPU96704.1 cyclic nucleotide-binding domain-containing protein [Candidatus Hydrogenedentota bacterium]
MLPAAKVDEMIRRVDLFRGLTREDVLKIFSKGMVVRNLKDEVIFYQGTTGSQMYIILGGKVGIFDGDVQIATLRTGDMFGEMALVNREPRCATAKALEDSLLFVLTETTFQTLLTKRVSVQLLLNIIHTLSERLKQHNLQMVRQTGGSACGPGG